jgi:hypothetical protein
MGDVPQRLQLRQDCLIDTNPIPAFRSGYGFGEFYNPYTGEANGAPVFGWSTLVIDMLAAVEDV